MTAARGVRLLGVVVTALGASAALSRPAQACSPASFALVAPAKDSVDVPTDVVPIYRTGYPNGYLFQLESESDAPISMRPRPARAEHGELVPERTLAPHTRYVLRGRWPDPTAFKAPEDFVHPFTTGAGPLAAAPPRVTATLTHVATKQGFACSSPPIGPVPYTCLALAGDPLVELTLLRRVAGGTFAEGTRLLVTSQLMTGYGEAWDCLRVRARGANGTFGEATTICGDTAPTRAMDETPFRCTGAGIDPPAPPPADVAGGCAVAGRAHASFLPFATALALALRWLRRRSARKTSQGARPLLRSVHARSTVTRLLLAACAATATWLALSVPVAACSRAGTWPTFELVYPTAATDVPTDVVPVYRPVGHAGAIDFILERDGAEPMPLTQRPAQAGHTDLLAPLPLLPHTRYTLRGRWGERTTVYPNQVDGAFTFTTGAGPAAAAPPVPAAKLTHFKTRFTSSCDPPDGYPQGRTCVGIAADLLTEIVPLQRTPGGSFSEGEARLARSHITTGFAIAWDCLRLRTRAANATYSEPVVVCGERATPRTIEDVSYRCTPAGITPPEQPKPDPYAPAFGCAIAATSPFAVSSATPLLVVAAFLLARLRQRRARR